jgi:tetratricopeptide (TPR) repeat protein
MAKVVKFPALPTQKFGNKPVRKKRATILEEKGQLNLFGGGKLVSITPYTPFEEALILDEKGDRRAKGLYLKAIENQEGVADSYCNLGILESDEKNYSKAINYFSQCLQLAPRHFEAHYNLANLYAEMGDFKLAKLHYLASIEIEPDFPNSYFNLGLAYAMNKEVEEAIQALLKYRSLASSDEKAFAEELINNLSRSI